VSQQKRKKAIAHFKEERKWRIPACEVRHYYYFIIITTHPEKLLKVWKTSTVIDSEAPPS
jgi:hypothetical protein